MRVIERGITTPAFTIEIPAAAPWYKHVAPHHESAGRDDAVDLGPVFIARFEHPGVQLLDRPVAERLRQGLARAGSVTVGGDRDVADDLVVHRRPCFRGFS